MAPVEITRKMAKNKELIGRLLRAGLSVKVVRKQPSRWDGPAYSKRYRA